MKIYQLLVATAVLLWMTGCSTLDVNDAVAVQTKELGQCVSNGSGKAMAFDNKRVNFICRDAYVLIGEAYEKDETHVIDAGRLNGKKGQHTLTDLRQVEIEKSIRSRCELKPEAGRCRAYFKKAYYDPKFQSCKEFVWGGCGGVVPFEDIDACEQACHY